MRAGTGGKPGKASTKPIRRAACCKWANIADWAAAGSRRHSASSTARCSSAVSQMWLWSANGRRRLWANGCSNCWITIASGTLPDRRAMAMWKARSCSAAATRSSLCSAASICCCSACRLASASASSWLAASAAAAGSRMARSWNTCCSECAAGPSGKGWLLRGKPAVTSTPLPGCERTRPSASSVEMASRSDARLMPSVTASSRCDGNSSPGRNRPCWICRCKVCAA